MKNTLERYIKIWQWFVFFLGCHFKEFNKKFTLASKIFFISTVIFLEIKVSDLVFVKKSRRFLWHSKLSNFVMMMMHTQDNLWMFLVRGYLIKDEKLIDQNIREGEKCNFRRIVNFPGKGGYRFARFLQCFPRLFSVSWLKLKSMKGTKVYEILSIFSIFFFPSVNPIQKSFP